MSLIMSKIGSISIGIMYCAGNFYTGGSNKKLTVTGKAVYIVGGDPINRVVMDCEESGFGFSVTPQVQVFSLSNVEMRNCVGYATVFSLIFTGVHTGS